MFYIVPLAVAIGLLIADVTGAISVSFWLIGGIAAFPFVVALFLLCIVQGCKIALDSLEEKGKL